MINKKWYSVETPSVFYEVCLPVNDADLTDIDHENLNRLESLSGQYCVPIQTTDNRRG